MKVVPTVLVLVTLAYVTAEPPVPVYGPPSGSFSAPSSTYGAPSGSFSGPSSTYGAPSGSFSAPSSTYGAPSGSFSGPSSTYGAPSGSFSAPSSTYGAPSGAFSAPSRPAVTISSRLGAGRKAGLSRNYGAPSLRSSAVSSSYSAPSSTYGAPAPVYGPPSGYSYDDARARLAQDDLAEPANYEYTYAVQDAASGSDFGHQESRQDDSAQGEYRVLLPDGRTQIVEYEANENGYQPRIRYEEPSGPYAASQRSQGGPYAASRNSLGGHY